jgi:hypothetical protein
LYSADIKAVCRHKAGTFSSRVNVLHKPPLAAALYHHRMEDVIVKMVDLESEINADLEDLIDLKTEIVATIKRVSSPELQTLLELRYLCFKTWEQIAVDMNYGIDNIFRIHRRALNCIETVQ